LASSRDMRRQQKTPNGACPREEAVKPRGTAGGPSVSPARPEDASREGNDNNLLEAMLARSNMLAALKRVEQNRGAPGVDGVTVESFRTYLRETGSAYVKNCSPGPTGRNPCAGSKSRNRAAECDFWESRP